MAQEVKVYKLEDKTIEIELLDENGDAIDLTTGFDNIVVFLRNADKTIMAKFSLTTTAGWGAITLSGTETGVLSFLVDSDTTKLATVGKKEVEVLLQKTDGAVPDGSYDTIMKQYILTLEESTSSTVTLP